MIGRNSQNNEIEEMDTNKVESTETGGNVLQAINNEVANLSLNGQPMDYPEGSILMGTALNDAQSEATFTFKMDEFSKIEDYEYVLSPPCMICNLPWKIMIMKKTYDAEIDWSQNSLGFFLQCNGESDSAVWTCNARAELIIVSQKEGVEDFDREIHHVFNFKENDWGFSYYLSWEDVIDPEKGYIKDDTVIFRAHVVADVPHGVS